MTFMHIHSSVGGFYFIGHEGKDGSGVERAAHIVLCKTIGLKIYNVPLMVAVGFYGGSSQYQGFTRENMHRESKSAA